MDCGHELGHAGGCPRCGAGARRVRQAAGAEAWGAGLPWWAAFALGVAAGYAWGWQAVAGCGL